jgi:putative endonuclease
MAKHNRTGILGEELAAQYLSGKGYSILHRNWRHLRWEVDIIAERNGMLHFIEVKMRTTTLFGHPEENVTVKKIKHMMSAAEEFVYANPYWKRIQFDVLSITALNDEPVEYFLIEDVYVH